MIAARLTYHAAPGFEAAVRDLLAVLGPLHARNGCGDRVVTEPRPGVFEEVLRFETREAFERWDDLAHGRDRRVAAVWHILEASTADTDFQIEDQENQP